MDVVDDDTLKAVRSKWQEDTEHLPTLVDELPKAGRLLSPQNSPYAHIACELARKELADTGGSFFDHRKVTISVYGNKADVTAALGFVGNLFNLDTTLVYPSGAHFMRWLPKGDRLAQDPATKDGEDVVIGSLEGEVWSVRQ